MNFIVTIDEYNMARPKMQDIPTWKMRGYAGAMLDLFEELNLKFLVDIGNYAGQSFRSSFRRGDRISFGKAHVEKYPDPLDVIRYDSKNDGTNLEILAYAVPIYKGPREAEVIVQSPIVFPGYSVHRVDCLGHQFVKKTIKDAFLHDIRKELRWLSEFGIEKRGNRIVYRYDVSGLVGGGDEDE